MIYRCIAIAFVLLAAAEINATPVRYSGVQRTQRLTAAINRDRLLRIWVVYVDQGDGIVIQLPPTHNYDPDPNDSDNTRSERVDVLIDGGSNPTSESWRISEFLETLYEVPGPVVEHAVITHHDQDHVAGLTELLSESSIGIRNIYHNGLASYLRSASFDGETPFSGNTRPQNAVFSWSSSSRRVTRAMGVLDTAGTHLLARYLVNDLADLRSKFDRGIFQGVYERLADAIVSRTEPFSVESFNRVNSERSFIETTATPNNPRVEFEVIWPRRRLRHYASRNWGKTINGNSLTFRLTYGDFEMLFTGDQNSESQRVLLNHLGNDTSPLSCDVLKVPHHGSNHGIEEFFEAVNPVVSVASMGEKGFKSKQLGSRNWEHPSTEIIELLGGPQRVFHTLIHETPFDYNELRTREAHHRLLEYSHVLIETDGVWFRAVEIPDIEEDLSQIPTVRNTRRGNGTRWIRAEGN